ncbi:MAG TPA: hypothetical protein VGB66_18180, partial [Longimicrobium sp.]
RGGGTRFPAVPNRWLVRRLDGGGTLQKSWVVESDYLHPLDASGRPAVAAPPNDDAGVPATAWPRGVPATFPVIRQQAGGHPGAAFRYMGRALPLDRWLGGGSAGTEYLNLPAFSPYPLTAMGYGEPAFAAYYPNCYSFFGFCDPDPSLDASASYEYQVIGWYNEAGLDPLQSADFGGLDNDAARYAALEREYAWVVGRDDQAQPFPQRVVCCASLVLTPGSVGGRTPAGSVELALAGTGGEALSALLATSMAAGDTAIKAQVEDQLEAMNLAPSLQGIQVDYAAAFDRLRHEKGFVGVGGGTRWAVLPQRTPPDRASAGDGGDAQPPLPDAVAGALDRLNAAQEAYDLTCQEIAELRYQAFFDWHKYLTVLHTSANWAPPYTTNAQSFEQFITDVDLALVNGRAALAGTLSAPADGTVWTAGGSATATLDTSNATLAPPSPANATLAVQVLLRLKALLDAVQAAGLASTVQVIAQPAERFWRPREPVVLLSGDVAVNSDRHGEDGDLPCVVVSVPDAPGTAAFVSAADTLKPAAGDPALQTQNAPPWHPILLEWGVSMLGVTAGRPSNPDTQTLDYDPAFLSDSFALQANVPDLTTTATPALGNRNSYEGRCVITPTAGTQLATNVGAYLAQATLYGVRDPAADGEAGYLDRLVAWFQQQHPAAAPPAAESDRANWIQVHRPFVDMDGNLLPATGLPAWYAARPVSGGGTVSGWPAARQAADPFYTAVRALAALPGMNVLSQALGGFNAALLLREQVLQIPVEDPLAAPGSHSAALTTGVAAAVASAHPFAPLDDKVFSPIRTGQVTLETIRLVDTFGQQWNAPLTGAPLVVSNGLTDPHQPKTAFLPPRFAAPARLDFRWLGALPGADGMEEVEMSSAPATTPIVGWLLPNNLESSLAVYDADGVALGSINALAEWSPAPAAENRIAAAEIPNPWLRRLVRRLVVDVGTPEGTVPVNGKTVTQAALRQEFLQGFLSTVDSALEAIEPASFAQHEALALLIGRPIAVARARVELRVMGQPLDARTAVPDGTIAGGTAITVSKSAAWKAFVDQSWSVFAYDWGHYFGCTQDQVLNNTCPFMGPSPPLEAYARTTHGFEKVGVPIRLGEHQLMNDGLVGFWTESGGDLDPVFHAPQALDGLALEPGVVWRPGTTTPSIRAWTEGRTDNLTLALQDDPLELTLLLDPRGVVHATCGVLPVRQLQIPSAYYAGALRRMGVTFRVGPLLTDSERLYAAVPREPGFAWSWVTRPDGSTWVETTEIADATEHAEFFNPPLLVEGWLKLTPTGDGA